MSAPSNVPHSALETAAPRLSRRERKKFAQRSRDAGDDGRVEAEQYSGEACDNDDSEMRCAAHELLRGIRAGALGRLLGIHKTSYRTVSAMSLMCKNATMVRPGKVSVSRGFYGSFALCALLASVAAWGALSWAAPPRTPTALAPTAHLR